MKILTFIIFQIIILFCPLYTVVVLCEVFNGFEIRDLQNTDDRFITETAPWTATTQIAPDLYTKCGNTYLMGGYNVLGTAGQNYVILDYFQRTYTNLPPHTYLYFSVNIWVLDNWDVPNGDMFHFIFQDRDQYLGWIARDNTRSENLCGTPGALDMKNLKVVGKSYHTESYLSLKVIAWLRKNPADASFGFRDLRIIFSSASSEAFMNDSCAALPLPFTDFYDYQCFCPEGFYETVLFSGDCQPCHAQCSSCFGPTEAECVDCAPGSSFDGTNCITCDPACGFCHGPSASECKTCNSGYFLWGTSTCIDTCDLPLKQSDDTYTAVCSKPCSLPNEYYYMVEDDCRASCDPTYDYQLISGVKTCTAPPVTPPTPPSNPVVVTCQAGQYLFENTECVSSCDPPLVKDSTNCERPCDDGDYYYTIEELCKDKCRSPYKSEEFDNGLKTCEKTRLSGTMNTVLVFVNTAGEAMQATVTASALLGVYNPALVTLVGFMKMLPYMKYMEVGYPTRLRLLLDNMNSTMISFSFGFSIPETIQDEFTKYSLPGRFDLYSLHSSFIVNYWEIMSSLMILLTVIAIFSISSYLARKYKKETAAVILEKLTLLVKWNFFFMVFCSNLDGVALFSSLELRNLHLNTFSAVASFLFCIFMNIFTVGVFYLITYIIKDMRREENRVFPEKIHNMYYKWREFQLFHVGSRQDTYVQHIFMFPYLFRLLIFYLTIAYLYPYPIAQTIIMTLIGFFMLCYMVSKRPFVSKIVFCQHVADEFLILIINFSVLALSALDLHGSEATATREFLGDVIISSNAFMNLVDNIFLILYLIVGFVTALAIMKQNKKSGLVAFIGTLLAPFESGGMDVYVTIEKSRPRPTSPISPSEIVHHHKNDILHALEKTQPFTPVIAKHDRFIQRQKIYERARRDSRDNSVINQSVLNNQSVHDDRDINSPKSPTIPLNFAESPSALSRLRSYRNLAKTRPSFIKNYDIPSLSIDSPQSSTTNEDKSMLMNDSADLTGTGNYTGRSTLLRSSRRNLTKTKSIFLEIAKNNSEDKALGGSKPRQSPQQRIIATKAKKKLVIPENLPTFQDSNASMS